MRRERLLLTLLLAVFAGRIALTYRVFNDTTDESFHISAGVEYLERGYYELEAQHPPLGRLVVAALPYGLAELRLGDAYTIWNGGAWQRRELPYYWLTLTLARMGNLVYAVALLVVVWRWSGALAGPRASLLACLLLVCCPNVLAHSALATLDIGAAASVLLGSYCLWRWSEQPGWGGALAAALAAAVAALTKFSAVFFLVPIGLVYLAAAMRGAGRRKLVGGLARLAACGVAAAVVVWAAYGFEVGALAPPGHQYRSGFQFEHPAQGAPRLLARLVENHTMPAPKLWQGMIDVLTHNEHGHLSYLLGELSPAGWWHYFLVAVGVKTTLPMLLLVLVALGLWAARGGRPRGLLYPVLALAVILLVSMSGRLNIGIRHVLAVYPLFAIVAGAMLAQVRGGWLRAAGVLVVWHAAESVAAHPDYLAYFNQIARGREERFLADSNLDWGQDLVRLAEYVERQGIPSVQLSYFGVTSPAKMHLPHTALDWHHPKAGWVAISVNHLVGIGTGDHARFFRERPPDGRAGKSIFVYNLSSEEAARFAASQ